MKKIILPLVLALCINSSNAQPHYHDTLKLQLQNQKTDTGRVNALCDLAFAYYESRPDTAMTIAIEALSLSQRIGYVKGEAASLNRMANAYGVIGGNNAKQLEVLLLALKLNEKINNIDGLHRNNNNIGVLYRDEDDNRQAIEYFFRAKSFAEKAGNKKSISTATINIGESYFRLGQFDSALIYVQQGQNIALEINDARMTGNSFRIMGDINSGKNQQELAQGYYRLSFPHFRSTDNYLSLCESLLGMAKSFEKSGQHDSAHYYANQSYQIAKLRGFMTNVRDAGRFLSLYYRNQRITDSAFFYQDITKAANDSLFSQQKQKQFQSLAFDEKLRQNEIAVARLKAREERSHNLQYAAIAVGLITLLILFLVLSHSIIVKKKFIEFFAVLGLLAVFEFINLFIHPYLAHATNNSPLFMLLILIGIGALLVPLHHKLQQWITAIMVEKNKKIRLAAAKKTIATLEGDSNSVK